MNDADIVEVEEVEDVVEEVEETVKSQHNINLRKSIMPKFSKSEEFVILKKMIFQIQSISPKKIILKFKKHLGESNNLPEGVYIFRDDEGDVLNPINTFARFDKMAKDSKKENKEK